MARLCFGVFLLTFLLKAASKGRAEPADIESVPGVKGEEVALLCLDSNGTDPASCYRFRWTKTTTETSGVKTIFEWPKASQGKKRASLEADEKGQMCLFLKALEKSDEGTYSCEIWDGWDLVQVKNMSLKVKDCRVLKAKKVTLDEPFTLQCPVTSIPLNVSWSRVKGDSVAPVSSERALADGEFLTIKSMSESDEGWYRCSYTDGEIQHCFDIYLQVKDAVETTAVPLPASTKPQKDLTVDEVFQTMKTEDDGGTRIPIIASVITGIVLLAALIGLFVFYRWRSQGFRQQQRSTAGFSNGSMEFYENLSLPRPQDYSNRVNSFYRTEEDQAYSCSQNVHMSGATVA